MSAAAQRSGVAVSVTLALLFYGLYRACIQMGFDGISTWLFGAMALLLAGLSVVQFAKQIRTWVLVRRLRTPIGIYGDTAMLNTISPLEMGLKTSNHDGEGLPLGALHGAKKPKLIFDDGDGHGMFVSSTGGGKTSSLSIGMCAALDKDRRLITTAKGPDLAFATYRHRKALGQNVICINPNRLLASHGMPAHSFNPVAHFVALARDGNPDLILKTQEVALVLRPETGKGDGGENEIFRKVGRSILQWCLIYLACKEAVTGKNICNLAELYRILYGSPQSLIDFFEEMQLCPDFDGTVRLSGERLAGKFKNAPKSAEGFLTEAQEAVAIYNPATLLGKSVVTSDFNPSDLKNPETPTTIHIIIPPEQSHLLSSYAGLCLNTLLTACIEANRFEPRVTVISDEFENLSDGPLPAILPTLKLGRSRGLQLLVFCQDIGGLRSRYGDDATAFFTQCAIQMVWNVRSVDDAEMWSKRAGQRSIVTDSVSMPNEGTEVSLGVKEEGISQMRSDDFLRMPDFVATFFYKQNPPIILDLVHYKMVAPWRDQIDPVPGALEEPDLPVAFKL